MTKLVEKEMNQWTPEEKQEIPVKYGCEILFERTTLEQIKNPKLPNDSYIVIYQSDNQTYMDLCRGKKTDVFDLYYDKFGSNSIKRIDYGYGTVNPKNWGYKKQNEKDKKK